MPSKKASKKNNQGRHYDEPAWALELLKGKDERSVIEHGHEKLEPLKRWHKDDLKLYFLSGREERQLRDEIEAFSPSLLRSDLTLKQKATLMRVKRANQARERKEGKAKRRVR